MCLVSQVSLAERPHNRLGSDALCSQNKAKPDKQK